MVGIGAALGKDLDVSSSHPSLLHDEDEMRECAAQYATVGVPNGPPTEGSCRSASGLAQVSEAQPSQIIHRVFSKVPVNSHPTNEPWASAVGGCTVRLLVQLSVGRRGCPDPDIYCPGTRLCDPSITPRNLSQGSYYPVICRACRLTLRRFLYLSQSRQ